MVLISVISVVSAAVREPACRRTSLEPPAAFAEAVAVSMEATMALTSVVRAAAAADFSAALDDGLMVAKVDSVM